MYKPYAYNSNSSGNKQSKPHTFRSKSRMNSGNRVEEEKYSGASVTHSTFSQSYLPNMNLDTNSEFIHGLSNHQTSHIIDDLPYDQSVSSSLSYPMYGSTNTNLTGYKQVNRLNRRYSALSSGVREQNSNYTQMNAPSDNYNSGYSNAQGYTPLSRSFSLQMTPTADSPSPMSPDGFRTPTNRYYQGLSPVFSQFPSEMESMTNDAYRSPSHYGSASLYYPTMNDSRAFQGNLPHAFNRHSSLDNSTFMSPFSNQQAYDWYNESDVPSRNGVPYSGNRVVDPQMQPYLYGSVNFQASQQPYSTAESYPVLKHPVNQMDAVNPVNQVNPMYSLHPMNPMNQSDDGFMPPMRRQERVPKMDKAESKGSVDTMDTMDLLDNADPAIEMASVNSLESSEFIDPSLSVDPSDSVGPMESMDLPERVSRGNRTSRLGRSDRSDHSDRYHVHAVVRVLQHPFYAALWNSRAKDRDGRGILYLQALKACSNVPARSLLTSLIKECIRYKKMCRISSTRVLFLELLCNYYHIVQIWLEFSRMEVESGEHRNAQFLLQCALDLYPHNVLIISKLVRIDERLQDLSEILSISNTLIEMNSQKAFRILIDIIIALAKLGDEAGAFRFIDFLLRSPQLCSRWLLHEILRFLANASSCSHVRSLIFQWMKRLPKHGPLWLFCHEYMEYLLSSDFPLAIRLDEANPYSQLTVWASQALNTDTMWKIYLSRMQRVVRAMFRCYQEAHQQGAWSDALQSIAEEGIMQLQLETRRCLQICPPPQKWKVFAVLGKSLAMIGFPNSARSVMRHSLHFCQEKCSHVLLLELARTEFFCHRTAQSVFLLKQSTLRFVDEWKLGLELMNELVMTNRQLEALHLCSNLLKLQFGAGRLWAMFIHMIHEMFGPEEALRYFHEALHHVAKSGEIWCEGARIFLDPTSPHFNPQNARIALNYSVFLTPQYGDSFIEGIRLLMISSNVFLQFHSCATDVLAYFLQSIPELIPYLRRCSFFVPNYGPLWYRCREQWLCPAMEVMIDAVIGCARAVARDAELYYTALRDLALQKQKEKKRLFRSRFSYAFLPDFDFVEEYVSSNLNRRIKCLLGSLPLDN